MNQQIATSQQEPASQQAGEQEAQENFTATKGKSFQNLTFTSQRSPIVTRSSIETLQRTIGNKAVQRLIQNQKVNSAAKVQRTGAAATATVQRNPEEVEAENNLEEDADAGKEALDSPAPLAPPDSQASAPGSGQESARQSPSPTEHLGSLPDFAAYKAHAEKQKALAPKPKRFKQASATDSAVNGTKSAYTFVKVAHSQLSNFLSTIKEWVGKGPGFGIKRFDIALEFLNPVVAAVGIDVVELLRAFYLLKVKRGLLKELKAQKKAVTDKGDTSDFAKAIVHSYGKVNRSVNTKWVGVIKAVMGAVGRLVTFVSGGTAALVSESLVILKDVMSVAQATFRSVKGVYKYIKGTKGLGRATSARSFLQVAASGDKPAARLLLKMDLYGLVQAAKKIKGKDSREANIILKGIAGLSKTADGENKVEELLVSYTGASDAVRKIVEEKVADQLKSF